MPKPSFLLDPAKAALAGLPLADEAFRLSAIELTKRNVLGYILNLLREPALKAIQRQERPHVHHSSTAAEGC
jgi:hypothetical protein